MSSTSFDRKQGETDDQWLVRLHLDPWFENATATELADFTGLGRGAARQALRKWAGSANVRRIHQHATAVAEKIGWPGDTAGLVHLALERYVQRFEDRERSQTPVELDGAIRGYLAENKVASDMPRKTVLPPDTEGG